MQSGYGGVSEMQEFLVDGCAPTLFSISSPPWPPPSYPAIAAIHPQSQPSHDLQLPYFHPIPITQQQTHHNHHHDHQLQPFQHLHPQLSVDRQSSTPTQLLNGRMLGSASNFMAADDSSGGEEDGSESHFHRHPWQREEEQSAIKEPFWRPLDIDYINPNNNNKSCNTKEPESSTNAYNKKSKEVMSDNYKLFSELEAIYNKPGRVPNNEARSGSALTGDDTPLLDRSPGEAVEAPPVELVGNIRGRRKRRRRNPQQLSLSIAGFFESLVNHLMEHQRKFLDAIERRDQDRMDRVEASRRQEAARTAREAAARARERALASAREAAIVELVERMTGQPLDLPPHGNDEMTTAPMNGRRWPRAEVQSLIRVRSGVGPRFREPGLKGPLWEEVSSAMGGLGYQRSAKRCKEKWENINKYFRKAKGSGSGSGGKKRTQQSKTCAYFHQLDQLYACSKQMQPSLPPMMGDSSTQLLNPATD